MGRRVGVDRHTGKLLVGWDHVRQSISTIVRTDFFERHQRRDLGSGIPSLVDKPQNEETILKFFMAVAIALEPRQMAHSVYGEPDFRLIAIGVDASTPGVLTASLVGYYYEDGRQVGTRRNVRVALPII